MLLFLTSLGYVFTTAIGLLFSWTFLMFGATSGRPPYLIGGLLAAVHLATYVFVWWKALQGKGSQSAFLLAMPALIVTAGCWLFLIGQHIIVTFVQPVSPAFTSECQGVGAQYYKLPLSPIRSIAYVWEGQYEPTYNRFILGFRHSIRDLRKSNFDHPNAIEFTERGRYGGPYTHYPSPLGASFVVNALSADVLVSFKMTPSDELRKSPSEQGMVRYELNVTDQRDGTSLAHLQYVIDAKKNRACGETGKNRMDEREFVLKAIGLEAQ